MVKRGLGSGLSALLESNVDMSITSEKVENIKLSKIFANKNQPRKSFNEEKLQELADSIKENGVIQPIIVQQENDSYMIIAGERRYRASKLAGLTEIPCIVKEYTPETLIKVSLLENIQREDLNAIEEAETYDQIIKNFGITQDTLAKELGKSRTYVTNTLRLLKLDEKIREYIIEGKLSHSTARTLITLSPEEQIAMADRIINNNLNTREAEVITKDKNSKKKNSKGNNSELPLEYREIESNLKNYLGTKIKIMSTKKSKKLEINFYNDEDLERILNLIIKCQ